MPWPVYQIGPALRCYTSGSAWAEFREACKGQIKPGYLCDLAILSRNPLEVPGQEIRDIKVDMTIVEGSVVYGREGAEVAAVTGPTGYAAAAG